MGSLQYHLFRLEKRDKIGSLKRGIYKSYFPAGVFQEQEMNIMRILNQSTTREILFLLLIKKILPKPK
jgi:predicted transcriptional regulator